MSKFDTITDFIAELEIAEHHAEQLMARMATYKKESAFTFARLYRIPAFRKLWDALDEMCRFSTRCME